MKIHILGGPGSGKTTLGRELAAKLQIPHYDLDLYGEKNGMNHQAWVDDVLSIAVQPGWVVENIGVIFIDPLLRGADHIVLLQPPWRVALWRIVLRHVIATLRGTNRYPGLKSLYALLTGARRYYCNSKTSPETAELMRTYLAEQRARMVEPTPEELVRQWERYSALIIPTNIAFVRAYLELYGQKVSVVKNNVDRTRLAARLTTR